MDSLEQLLEKYSSGEPAEVQAIKRYIQEEFQMDSRVGLQGEALVITVESASLANALRLRQTAIQAAANTKRRLLFRIG